jgi:predicted CXXCH cytochrome family protein
VTDENRRFEKGFFTAHRFAVAAEYLALTSRARLFVGGGVFGLVLIAFFLADAFVGRAAAVTGSLSESHALFARDCSTCHTPGDGATNAKCQSCHLRSGGDPAMFSFPRHYEYHSGNVDRAAPAHKEASCASCHREHRGREGALTRVADAQCVSCHMTGSFEKGHPEFEFVAKKLSDRANLKFQHVLHVRELMDRDSLKEAEASCLTCHRPKSDGRAFEPISYATGCDGCHLRATEATPWLPLRSGAAPGAVTLAEIRKASEPGSQWAEHWNPNEFTEQGGRIRKRPVYHADPWVLDNTRRLRRELYPGADLADLLRTSPEVSARDSRLLYAEAIQTLKGQIETLAGDSSPDVQRELGVLRQVMKEVERRVDGSAPLDQTKLAVSDANRDTTRSEPAYRVLVDSLTQPCQLCHFVEKATIRRVQTDQRSLERAEFNHRAHVVHARCLDCHGVIPIRESLAANVDPPPERDRADILNLPSIATCRACHTDRAAPTRCTSCHVFHPDKSHLSRLSR